MSANRVRTVIGLSIAIVTLALAGAAQAMTLDVGSPNLTARVFVTVPVTVTCDPVSAGLTVFSQSVTVRVEQAAGRGIARGTGGLGSSYPSLLFPCDGSAQTLAVTVLADPAGPPFHGGPAILTATGNSTAGIPLGFGSFMGPFETQSVSIAATQVTLH
jgi:hypothetical protein